MALVPIVEGTEDGVPGRRDVLPADGERSPRRTAVRRHRSPGRLAGIAAAEPAPPVPPEGADPVVERRARDRLQQHRGRVRPDELGVELEDPVLERLGVVAVGGRVRFRDGIAVHRGRPVRPPVVQEVAAQRVPRLRHVDLDVRLPQVPRQLHRREIRAILRRLRQRPRRCRTAPTGEHQGEHQSDRDPETAKPYHRHLTRLPSFLAAAIEATTRGATTPNDPSLA